MLATTWPSAFSDPGWLFEVKWDGVRAMVSGDGRAFTIRSRRGREITAAYPELGGFVPQRPCVLDGEIVAFDASGRPSFEVLQKRMNLSGGAAVAEMARTVPVTYVVFDLLYDGEDISRLPIEERLGRLAEVDGPAQFVQSEVIETAGEALFAAVVDRGLEGIVAKRRRSVYRPGVRSPDWRKIPHVQTVRALVGGFTRGEGGRSGTFGSLVLGLRDGGNLRWIGSVGTGFDDPSLRAIRDALDELTVDDNPFLPDSGLSPGIRWVSPRLVARVVFKEWTRAGRLRAPSFKGFDSAAPEDVTWESEGPGSS